MAGVADQLPTFLRARVDLVLDAWDGLAPETRARVDDDVGAAIAAATARVGRELQALLATDPSSQLATPLQVVRDAVREPTAVLADARIPDVVRDEFEERSLPLDRYGLAPRTFADLGDDLGPVQLAWGMAKAAFVRASSAKDRR